MLPSDPIYTATMTDQQRTWFYAEYEQARKDEMVGVLLALFLGSFGIHKFYLHQNNSGVLYLVFFWTGIPAFLGFVECFLMPGRVRDYNASQASFIAGQILAHPTNGATPTDPKPFYSAGSIPTTQFCAACGQTIDPTAIFCPHCGAARSAI
ncbi:NINE protein [Granulicella sp. dw_53]|uniref:NINE protein n=1 Tax=Granulicella sp. dw_53 TaxID=2719792 RepID=UPI001BD46D96|nr:NINE protein [Granulicella sp. dw_53]